MRPSTSVRQKSALLGIVAGLWTGIVQAEYWVAVGSYQSPEHARESVGLLEAQLGVVLTRREVMVGNET